MKILFEPRQQLPTSFPNPLTLRTCGVSGFKAAVHPEASKSVLGRISKDERGEAFKCNFINAPFPDTLLKKSKPSRTHRNVLINENCTRRRAHHFPRTRLAFPANPSKESVNLSRLIKNMVTTHHPFVRQPR